MGRLGVAGTEGDVFQRAAERLKSMGFMDRSCCYGSRCGPRVIFQDSG